MLKRIITGTFIVVTMIAFFLLRQFVDYRLFNILVYLLAILGTFEMTRAFSDGLTFFTRSVIWAHVVTFAPVATFFSLQSAFIVSFAAMLLALSALVFEFKSVKPETVGYAMLVIFYPTMLLGTMLGVNMLGQEQGFIPTVLIFAIACSADTFAYFVGTIFRGKQLSPEISPKKTISGFIGGLIGAMLCSALVYIVFPAAKGVFSLGDFEWAAYLATGLIGAMISVFGDLVEGAMKRKLCLKDIGNILPGHGGILDRFDSMLAAVPFVLLYLVIINLL